MSRLFCLFLAISSFLFYPLNGFPAKYGVLLNENNGPSNALLNVLDYYAISHDGSWESIVKETQEKWMRKKGTERWELFSEKPKNPVYEFALLYDLNLVQTNHAAGSDYHYAILLGATVNAVRERLAFLKEEWENGVRFSKLILFGSERPLDNKIENREVLLHPDERFPIQESWNFDGHLPNTELEMMIFLLDQMDLPQEWRQIPVEIVNAPMKREGDKVVRATTADTFQAWFNTHPEPGLILSVSSQPFVGYQDTIPRAILSMPLFPIDTVGPGVGFARFFHSNQAIPVILDNLAKWIYSLNAILSKEVSSSALAGSIFTSERSSFLLKER